MDQKKFEKIIKNSKLMIGTPMYGGMCFSHYVIGLTGLIGLAAQIKLKLDLSLVGNESLISQARNRIADHFMHSDCTHLMWIDADTSFKAEDVLELLLLDKDIVTGLVPTKAIDWGKIKKNATKEAVDGLTAKDLSELGICYAFDGDASKANTKSLFEINHGGGAFLMIKKKVFEDYKEAYPELEYKSLRTGREFGTNSKVPALNKKPEKMFAYFDTCIDKETENYISEDYFFSANARKMGYKIWACPWVKLGHVGTYCFEGNLENSLG